MFGSAPEGPSRSEWRVPQPACVIVIRGQIACYASRTSFRKTTAASACWMARRWRSSPASAARSSAPTARANRRCSRSSPASRTPTAVACRCPRRERRRLPGRRTPAVQPGRSLHDEVLSAVADLLGIEERDARARADDRATPSARPRRAGASPRRRCRSSSSGAAGTPSRPRSAASWPGSGFAETDRDRPTAGVLGRLADAHRARATAARPTGRAAARRADQSPGPGGHRVAGGLRRRPAARRC